MVQTMQVKLPGGLSQNGGVQRLAQFRPFTGRIEQTLIESADLLDRSAYVTRVLVATLEQIGDQSVSAEQVDSLCVADRQFLMLRLAIMLDGEQLWLKLGCGHCEALFDVEIQRGDLPVKQAGAGYPSSSLTIKGGEVEIRVPTGADQAGIAGLADDEAVRVLLQRCLKQMNGKQMSRAFIDNLDASEIETIDQALDDLSPAVCNQLLVNCPECKKEQNAELDHYRFDSVNGHHFHDEVHTLASNYHWSEAEILDLPQSRRRLYLEMISRAAGMSQ